jgi:hypothetical protein
MAADFSDQGRTFPVITAAALVVLIAGYLAVALIPALRNRAGGLIADGGGMEEMVAQIEQEAAEHIDEQHDSIPDGHNRPLASATEDVAVAERVKLSAAEQTTAAEPQAAEDPDDMNRRLRMSLLLVVGLLIGIILFGIELTVPVIFVLFLRLVTKESWLTTALTTVISCAVLYLVFHTLLDVPLEGGLLVAY